MKILGKPVVAFWGDKLREALKDERLARKALEIEFALCDEPSLVGAGGHLHVIARKPLRPSYARASRAYAS